MPVLSMLPRPTPPPLGDLIQGCRVRQGGHVTVREDDGRGGGRINLGPWGGIGA